MFTVVSVIDDSLGDIHPVMAFPGRITPVGRWAFGPDMAGSFITQIDYVDADSPQSAMEEVKRTFEL